VRFLRRTANTPTAGLTAAERPPRVPLPSGTRAVRLCPPSGLKSGAYWLAYVFPFGAIVTGVCIRERRMAGMIPALPSSSGSPTDWLNTFLVGLACLFPIFIFIRFLLDTTPTSGPRDRTEPRPPPTYGADWPSFGGPQPPGPEYGPPTEWASLRKACFRRANYRCERCGATRVRLIAHHPRKLPYGPNDLTNLQALCQRCHFEAHPKMAWHVREQGRGQRPSAR
jgi:hypothetical protein